MADGAPCLHCGRPAYQARGLCKRCYDRPAIRRRYPLLKDCGGSGALLDFCGAGKEPVPTKAPPRTPERLAVLTGRASRGEKLFHPHDARLDLG